MNLSFPRKREPSDFESGKTLDPRLRGDDKKKHQTRKPKQRAPARTRGPIRASRRFGVSGRVRRQDGLRSADKAGRRISTCPKPIMPKRRAVSPKQPNRFWRVGRVSLPSFFARAKKEGRPPGRDPTMKEVDLNGVAEMGPKENPGNCFATTRGYKNYVDYSGLKSKQYFLSDRTLSPARNFHFKNTSTATLSKTYFGLES